MRARWRPLGCFSAGFSYVCREGLEAEIESELEECRRSECLEFSRCVVAASDGVVALRIAAPIVRPQLEVSGREDEARVARARLRGDALRDIERYRRFTPFHERARLKEAVERLLRSRERCNHHRLLLERRVRIEQAVAVRTRAANAL